MRGKSASARELRREIFLTAVGLAITVGAALLAGRDILGVLGLRLDAHQWGSGLVQALFLVIAAFLIYGGCMYQLARLGLLRRLASHVPVSAEVLHEVYQEQDPPLLTALVPSYKEDARVIRRTLLCAALQEYPHRRVVLLIDDPPSPRSRDDASRLEAARSLPREIEDLLAEPTKQCAGAFEACLERLAIGQSSAAAESLTLAELYEEVAAWFEARADEYTIVDHADRLFVEVTFRGPAGDCRVEARRLRAVARAAVSAGERPDAPALRMGYARLLARFHTELTSFERKRYENLSHASNKAMNLNSYIGLLDGQYREVALRHTLVLVPATRGPADVSVPASEFLLIVDADSVLTPDYALRLIHLLRTPGNERVAIAQTPYSAFPGAPGAVERVAGATTDIQYLLHQGFTHYGGTYWVGANAIARTAALADIATRGAERGYTVTRFVQDRTVIEDTESTVDLLARGWRLHNYPERLAFSETPPDFGSLLVQRRRWANGGLIILPKLLHHLARTGVRRHRLSRALLMAHYLTSLAAVNAGLLIVLALSFEDSMRTAWLPLTAVPYYALYAWDLKRLGRRLTDVARVYALNLVLIPVNLAGVLRSLQQAMTGRKAAFGRTPKVQGRTRVPAVYLVATYGLLAAWLAGFLWDVISGRPLHALLTLTNAAFLVYGVATLIGFRHSLDDFAAALAHRRRFHTS